MRFLCNVKEEKEQKEQPLCKMKSQQQNKKCVGLQDLNAVLFPQLKQHQQMRKS